MSCSSRAIRALLGDSDTSGDCALMLGPGRAILGLFGLLSALVQREASEPPIRNIAGR
jgi:hypothetical protein